jgi:DNA modification methylase
MPGLSEMTVPAMSACHGLEPDILSYVAHEVVVFREVKRVLRKDGVLWLNLGDSSAAQQGKQNLSKSATSTRGGGHKVGSVSYNMPGNPFGKKQILGVPWRVAFALQADGWILRLDNIWHKPNCMPESVTDRPTRNHEYVFLLTKSPSYFYDHEAIKEATSGTAHSRGNGVNAKIRANGPNPRMARDRVPNERKTNESAWNLRPRQNASFSAAVSQLVTKRNKRSVWSVGSHPYKGAHFATFPPKLIEPCILAGTSEWGCCEKCGTPWTRIIEKGEPDIEHQRLCGGDKNGEYNGQATKDYTAARAQDPSAVKARILAGMVEKKTVGWESGCDCFGKVAVASECRASTANVVPCVVLDPFGGSGTTGKVALENNRHAILCEGNPEYVPMIHERCNITPPALINA